MPRVAFTVAELERAAKAAKRQGMIVEVTRGAIRLLPMPPEARTVPADDDSAEAACDAAFGMGVSG